MQLPYSQKIVDKLYPHVASFCVANGSEAPATMINDFDQAVSGVNMLFSIIEKTAVDYGYDIVLQTLNDTHAMRNIVHLIQVLAHVELDIAEANGALPITNIESLIALDFNRLLDSRTNYGDSWCKRGGIGAFMMLARKYDRLAQYIDTRGVAALLTDDRREGVVDDIGDLRRYLLLCYGLRCSIGDEAAGGV